MMAFALRVVLLTAGLLLTSCDRPEPGSPIPAPPPTPPAPTENPAFWKHAVKGDFADVLARLKTGLQVAQFQLTGEENLAQGLANNRHLFPDGQWNSIGFDNVTALHFCSVVFNQQVFNIKVDWSILCPFKLVAYSMKAAPDEVTIVTVRPTYLLANDPHPRAKEIGKSIEDRIVAAIREGLT
jgi:uncharacterized protein (DUF302 family)